MKKSIMAKKRIEEPITLENVSLLFRNFTGEERPYNKQGERNFCIILPPDIAQAMTRDGWNIKQAKPREDEQEVPPYYVQAKLGYGGKGRPPRVVIITSRGRNTLTQSQVSMLDWAEIEVCDVIIRPYNWDVQGNQGITAYVQTMYVTIREDDLDRKYAEVPDADAHQEPDEGPPWDD